MMQAEADAKLRDQIENVQAEFPFYGYRRVHEHLERHCGVTVNKKRLQRVMRENGLRALIWRGFKVKTTDSEHDHGFAPNLLPGRTIDRPNQVWVADITYSAPGSRLSQRDLSMTGIHLEKGDEPIMTTLRYGRVRAEAAVTCCTLAG
jgi:putative transposase